MNTITRMRELNAVGALENWDHLQAWVKAANIGGDPQAGFEQSLAQLSFSYIQDSAPRLLDFMVGFQLVDRNEDNTKAMGLFGFNVTGEWVYAPIFFINGELKGNELLYLKSPDKFVPLKENWVNYVLGRKSHSLGEGMQQTPQQMGVRQPDLRSFSTPPTSSKYGSARFEDVKYLDDLDEPIRDKIASWVNENPWEMDKYAQLDERLSLRRFLAEDFSLVKAAVELTDRYPLLERQIQQLHGDLLADVLRDMHKAATATSILNPRPRALETTAEINILGRPKQAAARPVDLRSLVELHVCDNTKLAQQAEQLDAAEYARLVRSGYVLRDKRAEEDRSSAFELDMRINLTNPDQSGLYDVLTSAGEYERCLVICNPQSGTGRAGMLTVLRLKSPRNWLNVSRTSVFARSVDSRAEYEEYVSDLSGSDSLSTGGVYVAMTETGDGSVPFEVYGSEGEGLYSVRFEDYPDYRYRRPDYLPALRPTRPADSNQPELVQLNNELGTKLKGLRNTLYVPKDAKVIKLKAADDECCDAASNNPPIQLGDLTDLTLAVRQKTALLRLYANGSEVHINQERFQKLAGLVHLVRDHGFSEEDAQTMLQRSEIRGGASFRVKYADQYPLPGGQEQGPGAPAIPEAEYGTEPLRGGNSVQSQYPQVDQMPVPELSAQQTDPQAYDTEQSPDPQALQVAQQAAQTGQREVFDTAMISGMLKAVREQSLVDRYVGDLMTALDRLGRILFMLFWHHDDFTDRFGKADMPELEDTLRNSFENLGDLVLFLNLKSVSNNPGQLLGSPSLRQSARN